MKLTALASLVLALSVAGCADSPLKMQIAGANIELAQKRAEAAAKPVLDARIPTPNGEMRIVVHAPPGGNQASITMPDDAWARVADRTVGVLGTAAGIYFGGTAAVGLVNAASQGIVGALRSQPDPVIVQPADAVIVPAAEPVIVEPVIVEPVIVNPVVVQLPPAQVVQVPVAP